ncbi:MAG: LamG domain-containing protein [Planctomycetaceae bacterium]|nr:LamG domain-containing protein [Planctomycetaceae bacterium]
MSRAPVNLSWGLWLALIVLGTSVRGEEPKWKLRVDLVDGSRVIGTTTHESLKVDVGFDELTIPLERIRRVQPGDNAKTVRVELNNRDIYTGKLKEEPLKLTTIFGEVTLKMAQIVSLEVVPNDLTGWLPTQKGLVLYYPLDDGDSVTNHAGDKLHGNSTKTKWIEKGLRDGSMEFDGTGRVVVANHQDLCPQALTFAAWIYPIGQSSSYQIVMAKTNSGSWSPGYGLVRNSGDAKHLQFFVNNYYNTTVKAEIPHDKWSHVAGVFDGATLSFYLNGKLVDSKNLKTAGLIPTNTDTPIQHTNSPLIFGGDQGQSYGWQGRIDEVVFYNRALSADDIWRIYDIVPRERGTLN